MAETIESNTDALVTLLVTMLPRVLDRKFMGVSDKVSIKK
jgi:hypothetical protein